MAYNKTYITDILLLLVLFFYTSVSLSQNPVVCQLDIDHIEVLRNCVIVHWRKTVGCNSLNSDEPIIYKLDVDSCNGSVFTFNVSIFTTTKTSFFERSICSSHCIIRLKNTTTCFVINTTIATYYEQKTEQLIDRCYRWKSTQSDDCISLHFNCTKFHATPEYEVSNSTNNYLLHLQDNVCYTELQSIDVTSKHYLKVQCNLGESTAYLNSSGCQIHNSMCYSIVVDQSVIEIHPIKSSDSVCETQHRSCPPDGTFLNLIEINGKPLDLLDPSPSSKDNNTTNNAAAYNPGIYLIIFLSCLFIINNCSFHNNIIIILIICLRQVSHGAVRFGERDVLVREGLQRSVAVDRTDSSSYLGIKVFASTIEAYRQRNLIPHGCNMTLDEMGVSDNQVDHAEDADFIVLEYELAFQADIREVTFNLELYDDILSEKEEMFILFTNYSESSTDNCAIAVRTLDNDWLMFNFSTSQDITISEDVGTFRNLSIIKIGQNEPDVTINIYTPANSGGQDFMFDQEYTFDANTTKQIVLLDIIDDTLVESRESFLLCLPTLRNTNSDVQLVTETSPSCVTIYIQDNEVARVGFKNTSDIMIQEGQGAAAMICAGFVDMGNITVDNFVYVSLEINITAINPGSGHEPYFLPYSSYFLDEGSPIDCLYIHSHYDSNLEESHFVLSLILDTTVNTVMISIMQQFTNVNLFITDFHGISFISQPSTVVTGVGKEAHFDCTYIGTNANPLWNITDFNNISRIVSTTRLPVDHFHSGSGLALKNIDESQNMTSYSCLFQVYDRDEIVILASEVGTLIVLETITFRLQVNNYVPLSSGHEYIIYEGEDAPEVSVIKTGYSTNVFCVPLIIKSLNEDQTTISEVDVENYCLSGTTNKLTLPLLSEYVQENPAREKLKTFLLEIDESIGSTSSEQTGACIEVVNEPLRIKIYDNDFLVGFTESNIAIDEGTTYNICLTMFEKDWFDKHFNASIDLTVSSYHPYLEFNLTEEVVTLNNANNYYGCFSNTFNLVGQCVGQKNITVNVLWVENHKYSRCIAVRIPQEDLVLSQFL